MGFINRLQHGWNAFLNKDPTETPKVMQEPSYFYRPDRYRLKQGNDRSIITAIYNRISLDVAALDIKHVRLDDNDRYREDIDSGLNYCLNVEANIDQTGRAFVQDIVFSLLDEGCVAVVPIETTINPKNTASYDVTNMRVGEVIQWKPTHVQVRVYNDATGRKEDIWLPKSFVGIIENPFYSIMNEPNSTVKRLMRKLALLDAVDEQTSSGKLDIIIQLPYSLKSQLRKDQAMERRNALEKQMEGSRLGIGYIDSSERIVQLNRPLENNLLKQIEDLRELLYSQLGITKEVMDGTANEQTMLNYTNRTIEPIVSAITDELLRKFLTKTARTQKQTVMSFKDPFRLVPVDNIADIADKFTRNEIMSSNEIRQIVGLKPSSDPDADELRNKNLNKSNAEMAEGPKPLQENQNGEPKMQQDGLGGEADAIMEEYFSGVEKSIDDIIGRYTE